jgi:hypothetical protein
MKAALKKLAIRLKTTPFLGKSVQFAVAFYRIPRSRAQLIELLKILPVIEKLSQRQREMDRDLPVALRKLRQSIKHQERFVGSSIPDQSHVIENRNIYDALNALRRIIGEQTPTNPASCGWQSYAQCDEDGIIRECLSRISSVTRLTYTFLEIGCGDGLENNTHQLLIDGFRGCWIDGNAENIEKISNSLDGLCHARLCIQYGFLSLENIDYCVADCMKKMDLTQEIDLLSLGTGGNDIHFVRSLLRTISPKLLCVEYNAKFPPPTRVEMEYCPHYTRQGDDYFGASLQSWVDSLSEYLLVSCNLSGANAFFVRRDCASPFKRFAPEKLYQPPRYWLTQARVGHPSSLRWLKQIVQSEKSTVSPYESRPQKAIHSS